jgi:hypothetical protein
MDGENVTRGRGHGPLYALREENNDITTTISASAKHGEKNIKVKFPD